MNEEPVDGRPRLIERGFPLRETSLASLHEKTVRHGHISTLHIWPARRPLAACRAALIATLLPDPGDPKKRAEIYRRLAGVLRPGGTSAKDIDGGILRWGTESSPDLEWFRKEIRSAYGGRSPRVLDPFAGGGSIPLEAMRLGCETSAIDINPVAWFVLKCTLEYPQRFAGKRWPLPSFANEGTQQAELTTSIFRDGNLADHVRAWGQWVLERAQKDLASYYPTVDSKTTVAYLWARTVRCKGCRATIPLLKTRWLCKTPRKTIALEMTCNADRSGVTFAVRELAKAERGKFDGSGTMTRSGAKCPCCPAQMSMEELRLEGRAGRMGTVMTAVVTEGAGGKGFRLPADVERERAAAAADALEALFAEIPYGLPTEPLPAAEALGFRVPLYGLDRWYKLFMPRQLLALGTLIKWVRAARSVASAMSIDANLSEAISAYLMCSVSKIADKNSTLVEWQPHRQCIGHTFSRFALPMSWDFVEVNVLSGSTGNYLDGLTWIADIVKRNLISGQAPEVQRGDAQDLAGASTYDVVLTDPPYYDAIPYADLMNFFYVWLRRTLTGLSEEYDRELHDPGAPTWDRKRHRGELIDDASRFDGDRLQSRKSYEDGMRRSFELAKAALRPDGRAVVVFANKNPAAWETLVAALVDAGFVVDGSWPIATEMASRSRALASAALSSSIWLVCRRRPDAAKDGWDTLVRDDMRARIRSRLRDFWDAGIRGPDFVWSAIGPALEAYSRHPRVKKVDAPGELMTIPEFLADVRREVVTFAAARVLATSGDNDDTANLDGLTTYYLLHRNDFGFEPAPVGASILYAISCGLRDTALVSDYDLLQRMKRQEPRVPPNADSALEEEIADGESDDVNTKTSDGTSVTLKAWDARIRPGLGEDEPSRPAPLIDQVHRLMRLWKLGDASKVNAYIAEHGLASSRLAREVIQALIELAPVRSEERSILEGISNQLGDVRAPTAQTSLLGA
jgi:putative DNA methylase